MTNRTLFTLGFLLASLAALPAHGQVVSQLRAARFYPPNMPNAPTTPGGGVIPGNRFPLCHVQHLRRTPRPRSFPTDLPQPA